MSYPDYSDLKNALLCFIYFNGDHESDYSIPAKETYEPLADYFELSKEEREEPHGINDYEWRNRVQFAKNFLKEEGSILDNHPSRPTIWRLSTLGTTRVHKIQSTYLSLENILQKRAIDFNIDRPESNKRVSAITTRIIRDTKLTKHIKHLYKNKCQLCGKALELRNNETYSEAHHIQPLGVPHNGPDIMQNIICVCPNHHAQLDFGAIELLDSQLETHPKHEIGHKYLAYHNEHIYKQ